MRPIIVVLFACLGRPLKVINHLAHENQTVHSIDHEALKTQDCLFIDRQSVHRTMWVPGYHCDDDNQWTPPYTVAENVLSFIYT
jgi:hypothetical protein